MTSEFYRAFEDRHRGPRELITSRLMGYLPLVETLMRFHPESQAVDLGCGRGEWVELLCQQGYECYGVDTDEAMIECMRSLRLSVINSDAIDHLKGLASESMALVTAFHLVEHLPFAALLELIHEARRVLVPGGVLILETPNSENLSVGTSSFYLDPTHERPLPAGLLSFCVDYQGFSRNHIYRLQESAALLTSCAPSLYEVLTGVSPDLAVIAQTLAQGDSYEALNHYFQLNTGVDLHTLAKRYDDALESSNSLIAASLNHQDALVQQSLSAASAAAEDASQAMVQAVAALETAQRLEAQVLARLQAVEASTSWRLTKPLRFSVDSMRTLNASLQNRYQLCQSLVRTRLISVLRRYRLLTPLKRCFTIIGLRYWKYTLSYPSGSSLQGSTTTLGPRAKQILVDLQDACSKIHGASR